MQHFNDFFLECRFCPCCKVLQCVQAESAYQVSTLVAQLKPNFRWCYKITKAGVWGFSPGKIFKIFNHYRWVLVHFWEENYHLWLHYFWGKTGICRLLKLLFFLGARICHLKARDDELLGGGAWPLWHSLCIHHWAKRHWPMTLHKVDVQLFTSYFAILSGCFPQYQ